jgi:DNA-binding NtrC family response regulator
LPRGLAHDEHERPTPAHTTAPAAPATPTHIFKLPPEGIVLDDLEMSLVQQALERSNGNQTRAAELLSISRDQLRYRLKKLESAGQEDAQA